MYFHSKRSTQSEEDKPSKVKRISNDVISQTVIIENSKVVFYSGASYEIIDELEVIAL